MGEESKGIKAQTTYIAVGIEDHTKGLVAIVYDDYKILAKILPSNEILPFLERFSKNELKTNDFDLVGGDIKRVFILDPRLLGGDEK